MVPPGDGLRETDAQAVHQARVLLRGARFGALAVADPQTGFPLASRVLLGTDVDGVPVTLVSALAPHTRALSADGRASILAGEPKKGDPLAHPRLSVRCQAESVPTESPAHVLLRARFLRRHEKSALYIDLPDFTFVRFVPIDARLNGGFGRAYQIGGDALSIRSPAIDAIAAMEAAAVEHMNADHADAARVYAARYAGEKPANWRFCGLDAAGFDLQARDRLARVEFDEVLLRSDELRVKLVTMLEGSD
ncbi:HugZ family pyridoxamine 5'-phosphate oxidase [Pararhizobium mangrovi]|uniref:HugZ family protein n=1 Tax=Pararhizobium mangrovi TaxID=2590452 RepID=A0A506UCY6_9HYPH|nr:DUF2470 domain-containing protein [Pararhizobium mangrovi]TPW31276.1 HugZ family protein [Pararhizobium mangrovi]